MSGKVYKRDKKVNLAILRILMHQEDLKDHRVLLVNKDQEVNVEKRAKKVLKDPAEEMANPVHLEIQEPMAHLDLPESLALAEALLLR